MRENDYPALYQAADIASLNAQTSYLKSVRWYIFLSILGAFLSLFSIQSKALAIVSALILLSGLFLSIFITKKKNEGIWYRTRAVAESIKTSTWRFMMHTEPFDSTIPLLQANAAFRDLLNKILNEHKNLALDLTINHSQPQITEKMAEVRAKSLEERKSIYLNERIDDQLNWYTNKSRHSKKWGERWFHAFIILQGVAILFAMLRVAYPEYSYWPTEVFIVASAGVFTWIQLKRFRELAASYNLAAHEISIAKGAIEQVNSEKDFSDFVRDTENAFSREHTQWVAKKE